MKEVVILSGKGGTGKTSIVGSFAAIAQSKVLADCDVDAADLDKVAYLLGEDYDIILTEGFKRGNAAKIEVHRKNAGPPLEGIKKLIGIVTDEPLETKARQFSTDSIKDIADLLEKGFIKPQKERISLHINDIPVTLTTFPKQIISNVLLAMASCLKSVGEVKNLQIFLKKG
jgi:hypothetical protein